MHTKYAGENFRLYINYLKPVHPFSYMNEKCQYVLSLLTDLWHKKNDGPLVTLDAGPNIHLLYREDQKAMAEAFKQSHLIGNFDVL